MLKFKIYTIPWIHTSPEKQGPFLQEKLNNFIMSILCCQVERGHPMEIPFIQKPCVTYVLQKPLTCIDASITWKGQVHICETNIQQKQTRSNIVSLILTWLQNAEATSYPYFWYEWTHWTQGGYLQRQGPPAYTHNGEVYIHHCLHPSPALWCVASVRKGSFSLTASVL